MGAKIEEIPGRGPYCFKISGEVYHKTSENILIDPNLNLQSIQNSSIKPTYAELYLYDSDMSIECRMNYPQNRLCLRENMISISKILDEFSPYAQSYRKLRQVFNNEKENAAAAGEIMSKVSLIFTRNVHDDQRVDNLPSSSDDVAAIFVADRDGNIPAELDFAVQVIAIH